MHTMIKKYRENRQKGITLIEILAVLVILALVFVALARNFGFGTDKAKMTDVQQAFKPYQIAFEGALNEYSGLPLAGTPLDNIDYKSLNRYLGKDYQITTPTNGTGTLMPTSNPANAVNLDDPWNTPYVIQANYISSTNTHLISIRTKGKDKKISNASNIYSFGTADTDDVIFVSQFRDGIVKSCTYGLEKNMGKIEGISTAGTGTITGCQ